MKNLQKFKATKFIFLSIIFTCFFSCKDDEYTRFEYSFPNKLSAFKKSELKRVTIFHTNNIAGRFSPFVETFEDGTTINVGGLDLMSAYLKTLRENVPHSLLLDSGNIFSLNGENNAQNFKKLIDLKYDAILLTENEIINFNNSEYSLPFVSSNIFEIKKDDITNVHGNAPYLIKTVDGVRFGIIGLTEYKEDVASNEKISGFVFDDPVAQFITTYHRIKSSIDVLIVLIHVDDQCKNVQLSEYFKCNKFNDNLQKIIDRLPPNTADIIIGGDAFLVKDPTKSHKVSRNFGKGMFLGVVNLYLDENNKVIDDKTEVLSPLKLCENFFDATADCHLNKDNASKYNLIKDSKFKLIKARILGVDIKL